MPIADNILDPGRNFFPTEYKDDIFMIWYRAGKPSAYTLHNIIPKTVDDKKPTRITLQDWITVFYQKAEILDQAVRDEMNNRMILEKIEMLNRHAEVGVEMQKKSLDYLRSEKSDLNSAAAVRMLVDGIRIEKESRGIPRILSKMAGMADDDLLKEAEKLLLRSPITEIETIDNTNYEQTDELPNL